VNNRNEKEMTFLQPALLVEFR